MTEDRGSATSRDGDRDREADRGIGEEMTCPCVAASERESATSGAMERVLAIRQAKAADESTGASKGFRV